MYSSCFTSRLQAGTTDSRRFHSSSLSPKQDPQRIVSCLLFHCCGARVELPALAAGRLWQGSLLLPAAGRDNFLSPLRALLRGLHLDSHQTLCWCVRTPILGRAGVLGVVFWTSLPANALFLTPSTLSVLWAKEER